MNLGKALEKLQNFVFLSSIIWAFQDDNVHRIISSDNFGGVDQDFLKKYDDVFADHMEEKILALSTMNQKLPYILPLEIVIGAQSRIFAGFPKDFIGKYNNLIYFAKFNALFESLNHFFNHLKLRYNLTSIKQVQQKISEIENHNQKELTQRAKMIHPNLYSDQVIN